MLKRRKFIAGTVLLGLSPYLNAKDKEPFLKQFISVKRVIAEVQEHMFPEHTLLPSASKAKVIDFLYQTISHQSYDKDIRAFVIEGAEEFITREKNFFSLSFVEKEKALRRYEESSYGSAWLSRIMTVTMEGMFADPIYGANPNEIGWQALHAFGGQPRAQGRYLANV